MHFGTVFGMVHFAQLQRFSHLTTVQVLGSTVLNSLIKLHNCNKHRISIFFISNELKSKI